jgi:predicted DNA-binding transcriptional regulator AlpA
MACDTPTIAMQARAECRKHIGEALAILYRLYDEAVCPNPRDIARAAVEIQRAEVIALMDKAIRARQ